MRIASIDFETANHSPLSACALGLAIFEDHELVESPYWLIKPPKGHGWFIEKWTRNIHGINWLDVCQKTEFGEIALEVVALLATADLVVAHNARFDLRVLHSLMEHFQITAPPFQHQCTLGLSRQTWPDLPNHQLSTLAAHLGIELKHHHAQSDAIVAGRVMLMVLQKKNNACIPAWLTLNHHNLTIRH